MEQHGRIKRQEHTWATWKLENEVKMLKKEDQNSFYSITQRFLGENFKRFETELLFLVLSLKKVSFLHYK